MSLCVGVVVFVEFGSFNVLMAMHTRAESLTRRNAFDRCAERQIAFDDVFGSKAGHSGAKFVPIIVKISSLAPSALAKSASSFGCEACQKKK